MTYLHTLFFEALPWLYFIGFILFGLKMISLARNRKAAAIAFGLFLQIYLPDPRAQITIEAVVERKQEVKKAQAGNKTPKNGEGSHKDD
ncbi:hypothetical protein [uncultured Paraglaciecola sp.]|uniref:hypothetical protein n=1 Tax=uncultured Paraglaciecola sp. TaxID=1765024 RepID=UPI002595AB5E|nr:hypothetical protein [uncultured Paraglaciecola sp.]